MTRLAIVGGDAYLPDGPLPNATVLVEDGRISAVRPGGVRPPDTPVLDARGLRVTPGLIDVHIHGLNGTDALSGQAAPIARNLVRHGVTAFLATTIAAPWPDLFRAVRQLGDAAANTPRLPGARVLGIHLEGPYISPATPGVMSPEHFRSPSIDELESLQQAASGAVRLITLAPELPGALELIDYAQRLGIRVSLGHSGADYQAARAAIGRGARHATHTFNAMRPFHHREPGLLGAALASPEVVCEAIADGAHLHPGALELLLRIKGGGGLCLVSDAAPFAGLPPGRYDWCGKTVLLDGRDARTETGTLAGSTRLLDDALRYLILEVGAHPVEAITAATLTPARSLGFSQLGAIEPGKAADLALFDRAWRCVATIVDGELAYSATAPTTVL